MDATALRTALHDGDGDISPDEFSRCVRELSRSDRIKVLFDLPDWSDEPVIPHYQQELLDYGDRKARAQTAPKKGRQVGATTVAGMLGADHALTHRDTDVLFAAPSQGTADEMFRECKKLFWNSPLGLEQFGIVNNNQQTWEFANGTRILSRTLGNVEQSNNSGNRGMSPSCVIVDEAAYTKDAVYTEEIRPFFITHDEYEFHLFSTPAGKSGYFYEKAGDEPECEGIRDVDEAYDTDFCWFSPYWPTKISPFADPEQIQNAKAELTDAEFQQEYLGMFTDPEASAIPMGTLRPNLTGSFKRQSRKRRYLGIDPARKGDDQAVAIDIDEDGTFWNAWAFDELTGPEFVDFIEQVHNNRSVPQSTVGCNTVPQDGYDAILIEENAVGGFGADFAERALGDVVRGITTSNKSKQNVYQRLITDLEAGELALPQYEPLIKQTTHIQKTLTTTGLARYSHPSGGHDDWPDALAFANWARHGNGDRLSTAGGAKASPTFGW